MENLTVAERYLAEREQRFEDFLEKSFEVVDEADLHDLELAPGMVFRVRMPDIAFYQAVGGLPLSFSERLAVAADPESVVVGLNDAERMRLISFGAKMARYMCVDPRLVLGIPKDSTELSVDVVTQGDLMKIVDFGKGGIRASGLNTFRGERQRTSVAGPNGKKLRRKAKRAPKS